MTPHEGGRKEKCKGRLKEKVKVHAAGMGC